MTNADFLQSRPELTAGAVIEAAETWYEATHSRADAETAGLLQKLAEWLAAPHTAETDKEATVVTTLTVTQHLRGQSADFALQSGTAQRIADNALRALREGLKMQQRVWGGPDHTEVTRVQVFGFDEGPQEAEA